MATLTECTRIADGKYPVILARRLGCLHFLLHSQNLPPKEVQPMVQDEYAQHYFATRHQILVTKPFLAEQKTFEAETVTILANI